MKHRRFSVEPICTTLDVSASAYYQRASGQRSARVVDDEQLLGRILELHGTNYYACAVVEPAAAARCGAS